MDSTKRRIRLKQWVISYLCLVTCCLKCFHAFDLPPLSLQHGHPLGDEQRSLLLQQQTGNEADGDMGIFPVTSVLDDLLRFPQYRLVFDGKDRIRQSSVHVEEELSVDERVDKLHNDLASKVATEAKVIVTLAGNKRYQCAIPLFNHESSLATQQAPAPQGKGEIEAGGDATGKSATSVADSAAEKDPRARALRLLRPLKTECLHLTIGWWSYEFCHMKHIKQYHQATSDADETSEYYLGYYVPEKSEMSGSIDVEKTSSSETPHDDGNKRYFSQYYHDGTKCDLTGEPRWTEVQFHCSARPEEYIASIDEYSTCQYRVIITTPRLCEDPAFRIIELPVYPIKCQEIVSDAFYRLTQVTDQTFNRAAKDVEDKKATSAKGTLDTQSHRPAKGSDKDNGDPMHDIRQRDIVVDVMNDPMFKEIIQRLQQNFLDLKDETASSPTDEGGTVTMKDIQQSLKIALEQLQGQHEKDPSRAKKRRSRDQHTTTDEGLHGLRAVTVSAGDLAEAIQSLQKSLQDLDQKTNTEENDHVTSRKKKNT